MLRVLVKFSKKSFKNSSKGITNSSRTLSEYHSTFFPGLPNRTSTYITIQSAYLALKGSKIIGNIRIMCGSSKKNYMFFWAPHSFVLPELAPFPLPFRFNFQSALSRKPLTRVQNTYTLDWKRFRQKPKCTLENLWTNLCGRISRETSKHPKRITG